MASDGGRASTTDGQMRLGPRGVVATVLIIIVISITVKHCVIPASLCHVVPLTHQDSNTKVLRWCASIPPRRMDDNLSPSRAVTDAP